MFIQIICVLSRTPSWLSEQIKNYQKRFPSDWQCELKLVKPQVKGTVAQSLRLEAESIKRLLPERSFVILLDEQGDRLNSTVFAQKLQMLHDQGQKIVFLIGGADGLDRSLTQYAQLVLSISDFTLMHLHAQLVLVEQLYRAFTICTQRPYHRDVRSM